MILSKEVSLEDDVDDDYEEEEKNHNGDNGATGECPVYTYDSA
jgi:hypothetical protein